MSHVSCYTLRGVISESCVHQCFLTIQPREPSPRRLQDVICCTRSLGGKFVSRSLVKALHRYLCQYGQLNLFNNEESMSKKNVCNLKTFIMNDIIVRLSQIADGTVTPRVKPRRRCVVCTTLVVWTMACLPLWFRHFLRPSLINCISGKEMWTRGAMVISV